MRKIVFILLFISTYSYSQDKTVTPNEARWCISNYHENISLNKIVHDLDSVLFGKNNEIKLDNRIITKYKSDSTQDIAKEVRWEQIVQNDSEIIKDQDKKITKITVKFVVIEAITVALLILALL